jgi:hypothetical protein
VTEKGFLDCLVDILKEKKKSPQRVVKIVLRLADLVTPTGIPRDVWEQGVLASLEEHQIPFSLVRTEGEEDPFVGLKALTCRQYHAALRLIQTEVDRKFVQVERNKDLQGKKYGRPPYGYAMRGGRLVVHPHQAQAVRTIFALSAKEVPPSEMVRTLKERFPNQVVFEEANLRRRSGKPRPEYWDHRKICRVLSKRLLYTTGEHVAADGTPVVCKDLIIVHTKESKS